MTLIHLFLISSLVWILYCMYVFILYLSEKIFCFSYCRKIIDKQLFPNIFNSPFWYFGGIQLMRRIHLLLISSLVWILYSIYIYLRNYFVFHIAAKLLTNSIFSIFLIVHCSISKMRLIHLLLISSLVWILYSVCLYIIFI